MLPTYRVPVLSPYESEKVKEIQKGKGEKTQETREYIFGRNSIRILRHFHVRPKSRIPPDLSLCLRTCGFDHLLSRISNLVSLAESIGDLNSSCFTVIQIKGIVMFCILLSFLVQNVFGFFVGFVFPFMSGILDMFF